MVSAPAGGVVGAAGEATSVALGFVRRWPYEAGAGVGGEPAEAPERRANSATGGVGTEGEGRPIDGPEGSAVSVPGGMGMLGFAIDVALDSLLRLWGLCNRSVGRTATGTEVLARAEGGGGAAASASRRLSSVEHRA
jgi:hypothetical protein